MVYYDSVFMLFLCNFRPGCSQRMFTNGMCSVEEIDTRLGDVTSVNDGMFVLVLLLRNLNVIAQT